MQQQKPIILPRHIVNQLLHQAQTHPDYEVCGLIGAKDDVPVSVYPVGNIAEDPKDHFRMDPEGQIAAMKTMRERGEALFAIYHSHPKAPAQPSEEDVSLAAYPDALYLIISLNTKGVLEMRGFLLSQNSLREIPLGMEEIRQ